MADGYGDDTAVRRVRRVAEQLGISAPEAAALALLAAGALAVLALLWHTGRPPPGAVEDIGGAEGIEVVADDLVVAVTGHVATPGLYELAGGARVADALDAAGGALPDAALETVNLARPLSDGEQLAVPGPAPPAGPGPPAAGDAAVPSGHGGAEPHPGAPAGAASPAGAAQGAGMASSAHRPDGTLDLNLATAADLETLPGIGPVLAERIVSHREANGPFAGPEGLKAVSGIGDKKFDAVADLISAG